MEKTRHGLEKTRHGLDVTWYGLKLNGYGFDVTQAWLGSMAKRKALEMTKLPLSIESKTRVKKSFGKRQ